jgi:hypothetical protein
LTTTDRVARAVFALLVIACFAAFFVTQRLKHTPTAVQLFKLSPGFSPSSAGPDTLERISFRLGRNDQVTVTIEDSAGAEVATLVRDRPVTRYKTVSLRWNGREGEARGYTIVRAADGYTSLLPANRGPLAPGGEYRVRVSLREQHRSVLSLRSFTLAAR